MPRITCTHDAWTELTTSAGPARLTIQRETRAAFWIVFAATNPGAGVRAPADNANYVMIGDDFPGLATTALAGGALRAWARPIADIAVTVNATEVL